MPGHWLSFTQPSEEWMVQKQNKTEHVKGPYFFRPTSQVSQTGV